MTWKLRVEFRILRYPRSSCGNMATGGEAVHGLGAGLWPFCPLHWAEFWVLGGRTWGRSRDTQALGNDAHGGLQPSRAGERGAPEVPGLVGELEWPASGCPKRKRNGHGHTGWTSHSGQKSWLGWVHGSWPERNSFITNILKRGRGVGRPDSLCGHLQQLTYLWKKPVGVIPDYYWIQLWTANRNEKNLLNKF